MTQQKSKILAVTVMALGLVNVSNLDGQETSWKDETALVSPQGDRTVVRKMNSDKVRFQNNAAQLAI